MKKIILIIFLILFLTACTNLDAYVPIEQHYKTLLELEKANSETESKSLEILELKEEVNTLENNLELSSEEIEKYNNLIGDLDGLLSCVYYMECENSEYTNWGIGFSINYQDKYFIITAGHYIENEYGLFNNFKFKINDKWIYPKLLTYEVTDTVPDYAIYYSDKIDNGLKVDLNNTEPDYRLGINKLIQENNNWGVDGECGSPIIDLDGEVIGIHVGYLSDIDDVLEAIDSLE